MSNGHLTLLIAILVLACPICGPHWAAAESREEAVVVDEEPAATEVADAVEKTAVKGSRTARAIEPRQIDGQAVYIRHSSDAFNDPDQRMWLEPKYFFVLSNNHDGTNALADGTVQPRQACQRLVEGHRPQTSGRDAYRGGWRWRSA